MVRRGPCGAGDNAASYAAKLAADRRGHRPGRAAGERDGSRICPADGGGGENGVNKLSEISTRRAVEPLESRHPRHRDYTFLGTTQSLCPECLAVVRAKIIARRPHPAFGHPL